MTSAFMHPCMSTATDRQVGVLGGVARHARVWPHGRASLARRRGCQCQSLPSFLAPDSSLHGLAPVLQHSCISTNSVSGCGVRGTQAWQMRNFTALASVDLPCLCSSAALAKESRIATSGPPTRRAERRFPRTRSPRSAFLLAVSERREAHLRLTSRPCGTVHSSHLGGVSYRLGGSRRMRPLPTAGASAGDRVLFSRSSTSGRSGVDPGSIRGRGPLRSPIRWKSGVGPGRSVADPGPLRPATRGPRPESGGARERGGARATAAWRWYARARMVEERGSALGGAGGDAPTLATGRGEQHHIHATPTSSEVASTQSVAPTHPLPIRARGDRRRRSPRSGSSS